MTCRIWHGIWMYASAIWTRIVNGNITQICISILRKMIASIFKFEFIRIHHQRKINNDPSVTRFARSVPAQMVIMCVRLYLHRNHKLKEQTQNHHTVDRWLLYTAASPSWTSVAANVAMSATANNTNERRTWQGSSRMCATTSERKCTRDRKKENKTKSGFIYNLESLKRDIKQNLSRKL